MNVYFFSSYYSPIKIIKQDGELGSMKSMESALSSALITSICSGLAIAQVVRDDQREKVQQA